jgi:DnaJ-class molecular chaperone
VSALRPSISARRGNHPAIGALVNGKEARMTQNNPQNSQKDDDGSRGQMPTSDGHQTLNPGDEALLGTPGTGEDVCPHCHGSGRIDGSTCTNCGGTGKIVKAIGGA